jgi:hypothetical protein
MFEKLESEFLHLFWQVAGLAFSFFGSPQSREVDDRIKEKLGAWRR